jgi:hypothetical protein
MISPRLFESLDPEERKLWHSHVFEVKSGMLIRPKPSTVPEAIWSTAELEEMKEVVKIYGKVYHLWQTDRGDKLPLGSPKLMTSYISGDQFDFENVVGDRDKRFDTSYSKKQGERKDIAEPDIHPDADTTWKR